MTLQRRDFLKIGAASALSAPAAAAFSRPIRAPHRSQARNVIFMVADGMSIGTLTLADLLSHMERGRGTRWVELWSDPAAQRASCATYSADALVTDSAASASAWSIGQRVNNYAISVTPDGRSPAPLLVAARDSGKATGLVTTTRVTHATPAAFIANVPRRTMEREIAEQILERRVDVVLGGGMRYFTNELLDAHRDVHVIRTAEQLAAAPADGRLLGLFAPQHMAFEIDRTTEHRAQPSLADMTRAALARLDRAPDGFVIQIEGGRVDHAAHSNDAPAMLRDQLAFDDALDVVLDFMRDRDDTLLILTTDHANANPGLTVYGGAGRRGLEKLAAAARSYEWIDAQSRVGPDRVEADALADFIQRATGVELRLNELAILRAALAGDPVDPYGPSNALWLVVGSLLANHFGIAFASGEHTSDFVEVTALGPGSNSLAPMTDLAGVHRVVVEALGLRSPAD